MDGRDRASWFVLGSTYLVSLGMGRKCYVPPYRILFQGTVSLSESSHSGDLPIGDYCAMYQYHVSCILHLQHEPPTSRARESYPGAVFVATLDAVFYFHAAAVFSGNFCHCCCGFTFFLLIVMNLLMWLVS